jgi:uncharacterized protein (DUF1778 family)
MTLTLAQARALFLVEEGRERDFIDLYYTNEIDLNYEYSDKDHCNLLTQAIIIQRFGLVKFMIEKKIPLNQEILNLAKARINLTEKQTDKFLGRAIYDLIKKALEENHG